MSRASAVRLQILLLRLLVAVIASSAALASLALLWRHRPEAPTLPSSLSSPLTTDVVEQLVFVAAWVLSALVIFWFLALSVRSLLVRPPPPQALRLGSMLRRRSGSLGRARLAVASARPAFEPPFPIVLRSLPSHELERTPVPAGAARVVPHPAIALLGPLTVVATRPRRRRLRAQTQELLAYLALHREGASTDELVELLWPNINLENARARVHRAVSEVRSQLGAAIVRSGARYVLDRDAVAVDLDQFERLLARASARSGVDRELLLERALAHVRGEPLAGTDYAWAAGDLQRLRAGVVDLLHDLGSLRLDRGNAAGALAAAEQALGLDAYDETAHRLAMRAESALRLREAIVSRYERLSRRLDAQLGLEPERETRLLYRHLLSQDSRATSAM